MSPRTPAILIATLLLAEGLLSAAALASDAEDIYQTPAAFVAEAFNNPPPSQTLWLSGELRDQVSDILGHAPRRIRERYWLADNRSLWILEEIGKERPITMGFVVDDGKLVDARVLVYRESRGWEIRLPRFTAQFTGATLENNAQLDRDIDGITGATLSVNAMHKLARVALLLHDKVTAAAPAVESARAGSDADDPP